MSEEFFLDFSGPGEFSLEMAVGPQGPKGDTAGLEVAESPVESGLNTRVLFNNNGKLGEYPISGTGDVAMTTDPAISITATGTTTARTLDNRFNEICNVKDYGAIGNNVADDTAAIQAAINAAVALGRGTVRFPGRGPYKVTDTLDVSQSAGNLAIEGDPSGTQIILHATSGKVLFNGVSDVFRTHNLVFKNLFLTEPQGVGATGAGNLAFDIKNKQETVWSNVKVFGYREAVCLEQSWAPLILNDCYFRSILGKTIYALDNSFNSARIFDSAFTGCGLSLSEPCINVGPSTNVEIRGNDFSTNYCHIQFNNCSGATVTSYFEDSTLGNFEFVDTDGVSSAINIIGCSLGAAGASIVRHVDGFNLIGNSLYNCAITYAATATRVAQFGNGLLGSASLGQPTYAAGVRPFTYSGDIEAFTYGLGGAQTVLYNEDIGGTSYSVLRSRQSGATGRISVGGTVDPSTYYDQTSHSFRSANGGTAYALLDNTSFRLRGGRPLQIDGSTSGTFTLQVPAVAGTNTLTLPAGTTNFTATGGASQVLRQSSEGGAFTVSQLDASDIANGWKVLAKSAAGVSHTGNTSETALATIAIPAGAMGPNGAIRVTILGNGTNSGNSKIIRVRFGGAGGTQYLASTTTTSPVVRMQGEISNRNSQSSQVGNNYLTTGGWHVGTVIETSSVDTSSAVDLVITGQLAAGGETVTVESFLVEVTYGA